MQRTKAACPYCNREISLSNLSRHEEACKVKINKKSYALIHDGLNCLFCGKECKNRNSLCNHERMCKANPDRQMSSGFAEYNKEHQAWNKGLTKETDNPDLVYAKEQQQILKKVEQTDFKNVSKEIKKEENKKSRGLLAVLKEQQLRPASADKKEEGVNQTNNVNPTDMRALVKNTATR